MTAYSQQQHRHPLNYFTFGKIKTDRKSITKFKLNTVKNKNCLSEWSLTIRGHFVSVIVDQAYTVSTTRTHIFREYLRKNEKVRETVFACSYGVQVIQTRTVGCFF